MSRLIPLIVILVFLVAVPVARAQEVKIFDCAAYGTGCTDAIPDNDAGGVSSLITVPAGLNPNCVIEDLDVSIMIAHTWRSDMDVTLEGPDGTSVELWTGIDAGSDDFAVTIDDEAATTIDAGPCGFAPPPGCIGAFGPEPPASLGDFDDLNPVGNWTLTVVDNSPADTGALLGWSLRMSFADTDGDTIFDCDDVCPNDAANDVDNDGVCGDVDNCPTVYNPPQADANGDGIGSACDPNPCGVSVAGATMLAMCALCALKLASCRRRVRR